MRRKAGKILMILGVLMILSAAGLLFYNKNQEQRAGENADAALTQVQELISCNDENKKPSPAVPLPEKKEVPMLESSEIEGYGYIGYLNIPSLGLELPVMDRWDYMRLRIAPCREKGETAEHLIIAGHNYTQHFGLLHTMKEGELISFTDMAGNVTEYTVAEVQTIEPGERDKVEDEKWNLVLYTCTYGGQHRVMVACKINE